MIDMLCVLEALRFNTLPMKDYNKLLYKLNSIIL